MATGSALRQRTLTALALGPLVMAAVLWLPTGFALVLALVVLVGAWEWTALAGIRAPLVRAAIWRWWPWVWRCSGRLHQWGWGGWSWHPWLWPGWGSSWCWRGCAEIPRSRARELGLLALGLPGPAAAPGWP